MNAHMTYYLGAKASPLNPTFYTQCLLAVRSATLLWSATTYLFLIFLLTFSFSFPLIEVLIHLIGL